jgi:hypothetical protein
MTVNKQRSTNIEVINELTLKYIAEYSDMSKDDLIDYIETHLTPRSQTVGWIETFHFINEMCESLIHRLFKKDAAATVGCYRTTPIPTVI